MFCKFCFVENARHEKWTSNRATCSFMPPSIPVTSAAGFGWSPEGQQDPEKSDPWCIVQGTWARWLEPCVDGVVGWAHYLGSHAWAKLGARPSRRWRKSREIEETISILIQQEVTWKQLNVAGASGVACGSATWQDVMAGELHSLMGTAGARVMQSFLICA